MSYSSTILGTTGLVSYYQLNETTGTTAIDSKGSNNGTYQGTPPGSFGLGTTSANPNLGTAVSFTNGTGNTSIPNSASLQISGSITVEAWLNSIQPATVQECVCKPFTSSASNPYFDYCLSNGRSGHFAFFIGIGSTYYEINANTTTSANTWYHVVGVYDGSHISIYINGVLDCTPLAVTGSINTNTQPLNIGSAGWGNFAECFNGIIDEVAIYNTALSSSTILNHYNTALAASGFTLTGPAGGFVGNASRNFTFTPTGGNYTGTITPTDSSSNGTFSPTTLTYNNSPASQTFTYTPSTSGSRLINATGSPTITQPSSLTYTAKTASTYNSAITGTSGLVSYYPMDETTGTIAIDHKGPNDGTYTAGYTLGSTSENPILGTAVTFDGSFSRISIPNSTSLQISGSISIECWMNASPGSISAISDFVSKPASPSDVSPYFDYCLSSGRSTHIAFIISMGSNYYQVNSNTVQVANTWYHVVGVYDGAHISIYINGVLDCTPVAVTGTVNTNSQPLIIGNSGWGNTESFAGLVDEVAIYNTALSGPTILSHYQTGSPIVIAATNGSMLLNL